MTLPGTGHATPSRQSAYTLAEVVVSMLILGLVCAGVYGGISASFQNVQATREDLRASQILVQTMELIRLYTWSESDPATNFLPTSFTEAYDNASSNGLTYQISVSVSNAPGVSEVYSNDLRIITVQAAWTNNNVPRTRSVSTYIARSGLLWYVPK